MRIICSLIAALIITASTALASPELHINIPEYALRLVENGQIVKTYSIAVGTPYEQTPVGSFQIFEKQTYPTWFPGSNFTDRTPVPPGPDNPLGTRWMEFKPNYGIHGTNKGWDISYPVSGGCIRMQDTDARELYEKVPIGTPVLISYQTLNLIEKQDGLYVSIMPDIYKRQSNTPEQLMLLFTAYAERYTLIQNASAPFKAEYDETVEIKIAVPNLQPNLPSHSLPVKEIPKTIKSGSEKTNKKK